MADREELCIQDKIKRIRTQIDFRPTRGHLDADLLYTVLMHYNRGGRTNMTASQLITVAYSSYDPSETADITKILDVRTRAKAFVEHFGISRKSDITRMIVNGADSITECTLLEPDKKFVCFDADDPAAVKLWNILESIRYRDRGNLINIWLYQYFAHGNCEYYNQLCATSLFCWLKEEYVYTADINTSRLNTVINSLWLNSCDLVDDEQLSEIDAHKEEEKDSLRVLMGIAEASRNPTF